MLKGHNFVAFTNGGSTSHGRSSGSLGVRAWPDGSTMLEPRESWQRGPSVAGKFATDWNWGYNSINSSMDAVGHHETEGPADPGHCEGFDLPKKQQRWNEFTEHTRRFIENAPGVSEFRFMSRGSVDAVAKAKRNRSSSDHELETDFEAIAYELQMLEQNIVTRDNPHLVHCDDFFSMPLTRDEREERANAKRAQSRGVVHSEHCVRLPLLDDQDVRNGDLPSDHAHSPVSPAQPESNEGKQNRSCVSHRLGHVRTLRDEVIPRADSGVDQSSHPHRAFNNCSDDDSYMPDNADGDGIDLSHSFAPESLKYVVVGEAE